MPMGGRDCDRRSEYTRRLCCATQLADREIGMVSLDPSGRLALRMAGDSIVILALTMN